ncbi:MAG: CHAT domain-containing protein [Magnetococcales bacterium]|nr:CHAT domain-containing protein [Magnetococcales bacterium]
MSRYHPFNRAVAGLLSVACVGAFMGPAHSWAKDPQVQQVAGHAQPAIDAKLQPLWQQVQKNPSDLNALEQMVAMALAEDKYSVPVLTLLHQLVAGAVGKTDQAMAEEYNRLVTTLLTEIPLAVRQPFEQLVTRSTAKVANKELTTWSQQLAQMHQAAQMGQGEQAILLGTAVLKKAQELFGDKHVLTFMATRDLGRLHFSNNQFDKAEPLLRKALSLATAVLGKNDVEVMTIHRLLTELYSTGLIRLAEAEKQALAAWNGYPGSVGKNHSLTLAAGMALARVWQNSGKLSQADSMWQDLCSRHEQGLGPFHPDTASCLTQWAALARVRGFYNDAQQRLDKARQIQQAVLADGHGDAIQTVIELAAVQRQLGQFQQAQALLQPLAQALSQAADPDGKRLLYRIKDEMAQLHEELGQFAAAETLTQEVLDYETATLGADHPDRLVTINNLAGIHRRQDRLVEAENEYNTALAQAKKQLGPRHLTVATLMNNLGLVYEQRGLYDVAEPLFKEAITLTKEAVGEDHPSTWANRNSLALLHESQGNFDQAEPLYTTIIDAATKKMGARHPDTAAYINNLAYLQLLRREYDKAAPLFEQVLATWKETLGENHQKTLKAMNNLARVRYHQGRLSEAETLLVKALELRRAALGAEHADTLRSMNDLALLRQAQGQHAVADQLFQQTVAIEEKVLGPQHPYTFETIDRYAGLREVMGQNDAAFALRQTGFQRRSTFLDRMMWVAGDNAREGYLRLHRPELDRYLVLLTRIDAGRAGQALIDLALQRKGILLKISSEISQVARLAEDPQLLKITQELRDNRKKLAALTLSGPTAETGDQYLATLQQLEKRIDELQGTLGRASQRFRASTQPVTVQQLVDRIPDGAVLVEFMTYQDGQGASRLLAGTLTKKGSEAQFGLVTFRQTLAAIEKEVLAYRKAIQDEDLDEDERNEMGQSIYDAVWAPLMPVIGDRKQVYVVPDGPLHILPFQALIDEKGHYLLQKLDLHLLTSSRDLLPEAIASSKSGLFMTIAGPDYDSDKVTAKTVLAEVQQRRSAGALPAADTRGIGGDLRDGLRAFSAGIRGLHFDPLPGAEKEGALIIGKAKEQGRSNQLLSRHDAQEKSLKEMKTTPEYLHVATHGFFLKADDNLKKRLLKLQRSADFQVAPPGDNPMLRSGLAFAGINANAPFLGDIGTENDGILTAMEVLGLNLSGTKLAVLSACETGLGEVHEGEGVYGLRRAFREAGVADLVVSLWEVSDAGTQALMTTFYQRLLKGMPVYQAFHEAQLEMMQSAQWKHPYIWSAFMLVGH